jgi:phosphopantothenoylcysteine decarboxylase / phosphopantothenate---cysteine ligase
MTLKIVDSLMHTTAINMPQTNHPKKIVLMVCSSIAAYKAAYLARLLTQYFEVHVLLSQHAKDFVGVPTFQGLTHQKVWLDWDDTDPKHMPHIELTRNAAAIIIAPASANCMAKIANGLADDLISTTVLARPHQCPVFIAPAMNHEMWWQMPTQRNLQQLKKDGVQILGPITGDQACGEHGMGKMLEPTDILDAVLFHLHAKPLIGQKIIITAGPTREYLDSVRYLSNDSSGLMGFMLAKVAAKLGAQVDLITGPSVYSTPLGVIRYDVLSAQQMYQRVHQQIQAQTPDIFIANAAVADWGIDHLNNQGLAKIKKNNFIDALKNMPWQLNPDIVKSVADLKEAQPKIYTVAFAAQSHDLAHYAQQKLIDKGVDMVVANHVNFINATQNQVTIFTKNIANSHDSNDVADLFIEKELPLSDKEKLADLIWQDILENIQQTAISKN